MRAVPMRAVPMRPVPVRIPVLRRAVPARPYDVPTRMPVTGRFDLHVSQIGASGREREREKGG